MEVEHDFSTRQSILSGNQNNLGGVKDNLSDPEVKWIRYKYDNMKIIDNFFSILPYAWHG